jgi:hypothetical protein
MLNPDHFMICSIFHPQDLEIYIRHITRHEMRCDEIRSDKMREEEKRGDEARQ